MVAAIAILAVRLARDAFLDNDRVDIASVAIAGLAAAALAAAKIPTPLVVLAAAAAGILRATL